MDVSSLDWNGIWREIQEKRTIRPKDSKGWDRRAPSFARHAGKSDYIGQFLQIMQPERHWRVLDVGSAAGTLAVPLAGRVTSITAMDPSSVMRSLLEERCRQEGISSIRIVNGRWEDDWEELGIEVHDVAIASRSLLIEDPRWAIEKLSRYASRRVYVSTIVKDGPFDRRLIEAAGRSFHPGADYIYLVNLLYQMDILAHVAFTVHEEKRTYRDFEEALEAMRWMVDPMTSEEEALLRDYLSRTLVATDGYWRLPCPRKVRWAVLWWDKA